LAGAQVVSEYLRGQLLQHFEIGAESPGEVGQVEGGVILVERPRALDRRRFSDQSSTCPPGLRRATRVDVSCSTRFFHAAGSCLITSKVS